MKQQGFYVYTPSVDWFFVTDKKNKTRSLGEKMANVMNSAAQMHVTADYVLYYMQRGTIEKKEMQPHGVYFDIKGIDGSWSAGDFLKNKLTQIVTL